jgi:outer membrane lipoprotein LolB
LVLAAGLLVAGCASLHPADQSEGARGVDAPFALQGRLSARHADRALSAHVDWNHAPPDDDTIALATPMGQTLAVMTRNRDRVTIDEGSGQRSTARSFDELTSTAFGVTIPVTGLAWWVRGEPHPGSAYRAERDGDERLQTLDQDGWAIVYSYADAAATLPRRITLAYPDTELRLVIDAWN